MMSNRYWGLLAAFVAGALGGFAPATVLAAEADEAAIEEVVVIGTRRAARSSADTPAPVDVITGEDFNRNAATDVQDLLRTAVPSYNVNQQPISDAATISRPANLRGLSPDNTLVLVNGKRRHRGSVISFLGGGISDGAQGVDVATLPSLALQRVEVLRDGASSQYGSDAIAGVINFVLRDEAEGGFLEVQGGSTYEGDGDNYRISGNIGLPLGDQGFLNLTGEYGNVDGTVRSIVRDDVLALIDAGNTFVSDFETINSYTDEVPQYWGAPDVDDDLKLFANMGFQVNENLELYGWANYAERTVTGGFFFRNPTNRGGVYRGPTVDAVTGAADPAGVASILVGDLDGLGTGGDCPAGIPLTQGGGLIADPTVLAAVQADPNCFSFVETIPTGFVPRFGGDAEDYSFALGGRGELNNGMTYDLSVVRGSNETNYFINNTVNASLGPNTPRDFIPGGQRQREWVINADFTYPVAVDAFASDLNVAFGGEWREEEFDLFAGDAASFALGPLADQGFSSSSNGFGGFPNDTNASQDAWALYVDLEADVTEQFTVQAAVRFEDYSAFGDTTNFKIAGLYRINENVALRGAFSTGFHAPTAGQANITNVTTQINNGVLVDQGTLPLNSVAGQLAADFIESMGNGRPELGPEEAENLSIGIAFDIGQTSWTIDYYNIDVDDRVALGANVDFLAALNSLNTSGTPFTTVGEGLTALDAAGTINRQDFLGLDDLLQFRFFANSFDTTTQGIDIVGRTGFDLGDGYSTVTLAFNWNETEVDSLGTVNPISTGRQAALEDQLPNFKGNVSWSHTQGNIRGLLRLNYFGEWDDTGNGFDDIGSEWLVDVEVGYDFENGLELIGGVNNLFDTFNDRNPAAGSFGQLYPESGPFGFQGGQYYLKARYSFN
ncbi:MAG: TonB-dependent receptor [Pseudomonadota bacterium]